ncbi:hypothetical protein CDL12_22441 [Handroanthus impetiginosus]|uniref:DUF4220 domain-containing protein n=1 Tax=Handroanthus impetiginosus TaxID=429701 RepID=A0A2G9GII6_9LAMI|nr:hypothetical protein CDL12_22441 [Handroanthus impetiginosus]
MVFVEKRRLFEVIPNRLIKFLTEWEVRVMIILSLTLQILLITLGKRRKYICKIWIRITLWCAYLLADWVANVSLGIISKNTLDECKKGRDVKDPLNQLMWFWAQFFLLHLGGPDTITAYSLEDNELWLRHLVGLLIQTGLSFYIVLVAFPASSWLPVLSVLIFVAGLIKYGERLFSLRAANSENFRDFMLSEPDPGPNYAKFMEEYALKEAEGFYVEAAEVIEIPVQDQHSYPNDSGKLIAEAYEFYITFKCLFADAILSFQDRDRSQPYFQKLSPKQAFDVVEVELGFVFDELYTKASIIYKGRGFILRMITFSFTFISLMAFLFFCDKGSYKKLDLTITYLLLVVAMFLEIYAVCVAVNSDWTRNWLSRHEGKTLSSLIIRSFQQPNEKRWSKKMAQHNLLDLCVRDKGTIYLTIHKFLSCFQINNYLEKHWYKRFLDVSLELQELIFKELDSYTRIHNYPTSLWNRKGSFTLENYNNLSNTKEGEFDQRILLWHIATDICYSLENVDSKGQISEHSKQISDYMLYLLLQCPFMLPIGIGTIRFRDTCAEVKEFLEERNVKNNKVKACKKLLKVNTEVAPGKVKGDRSKSVLFDACKMAKSLMERKEEKWEIISKVWVELLAYAATHCRGNHHARQLRKGGELITHVWLLMAHLGITEQFQINQGHARAKLIVK